MICFKLFLQFLTFDFFIHHSTIFNPQGKTECSVTLSKDGWGWFVSGRHLVVWKYSKTAGAIPASSRRASVISTPKAYELILPPTDLAHKADLVAVFCSEHDRLPACLAISPEGTVRYWSSVSQENSFVEINIDLQVSRKYCFHK